MQRAKTIHSAWRGCAWLLLLLLTFGFGGLCSVSGPGLQRCSRRITLRKAIEGAADVTSWTNDEKALEDDWHERRLHRFRAAVRSIGSPGRDQTWMGSYDNQIRGVGRGRPVGIPPAPDLPDALTYQFLDSEGVEKAPTDFVKRAKHSLRDRGSKRNREACFFEYTLRVNDTQISLPGRMLTSGQQPPCPGRAAIREQVEYYLSDENLRHDEFFHRQISNDSAGWLDMNLILACRKITKMCIVGEDVVEALKGSSLEVRDDGGAIRRAGNTPLPALALRIPGEARVATPRKGSDEDQSTDPDASESRYPLLPVTIGHDRSRDAEFLALGVVFDRAQRLVGGDGDMVAVHGQVLIHITMRPCLSCMGAFAQLRRWLPHLAILVSFTPTTGESASTLSRKRKRRRVGPHQRRLRASKVKANRWYFTPSSWLRSLHRLNPLRWVRRAVHNLRKGRT